MSISLPLIILAAVFFAMLFSTVGALLAGEWKRAIGSAIATGITLCGGVVFLLFMRQHLTNAPQVVVVGRNVSPSETDRSVLEPRIELGTGGVEVNMNRQIGPRPVVTVNGRVAVTAPDPPPAPTEVEAGEATVVSGSGRAAAKSANAAAPKKATPTASIAARAGAPPAPGGEPAAADPSSDEAPAEPSQPAKNASESTKNGAKESEPEAATAPPTPAAESASDNNAKPAIAVGKPGDGAKRPAWITDLDLMEDGIYRRTVLVSDPLSELRDCQVDLDKKIIIAAAEFAESIMGKSDIRSIGGNPAYGLHRAQWLLRDLDLTLGDIRRDCVRETYVQDYESERLTRPLKEVFVLVEFDEAFEADVKNRWKEAEMRARTREARNNVETICVLGTVVLALLGVFYGILRFDTATKGYYTRRLILGGVAATILLVLFGIISDNM